MQPLPQSFDANAFFLQALGDFSPQRRDELAQLVARYNIYFVLDEQSAGIDFWSVPSTGQINVPRRCLFRLKASAYAYYSAVAEMTARQMGNADPGLDERLRKASELLTWAVRTDVATSLGDGSTFSLGAIPADFEQLCRSCLRPEQLDVAEEVFRLAVAWILHHEIAHIRLQHSASPGPDAVQEEWEADRASTDWLLRVPGMSQADRLARFCGVAAGLGWLSALYVYLGHGQSQTHPPEGERFVKQ
jgi:hypothetical protein